MSRGFTAYTLRGTCLDVVISSMVFDIFIVPRIGSPALVSTRICYILDMYGSQCLHFIVKKIKLHVLLEVD